MKIGIFAHYLASGGTDNAWYNPRYNKISYENKNLENEVGQSYLFVKPIFSPSSMCLKNVTLCLGLGLFLVCS